MEKARFALAERIVMAKERFDDMSVKT